MRHAIELHMRPDGDIEPLGSGDIPGTRWQGEERLAFLFKVTRFDTAILESHCVTVAVGDGYNEHAVIVSAWWIDGG